MEVQFSSLKVGNGISKDWHRGTLDVAVKKLDPKLVAADTPIVQRFLTKKISELKALSHPNFVHVMDMVRNGDEVYLITEYVNNPVSLEDLVRTKKAELSWVHKAKIAAQIAGVLNFLHKKNVQHQNLKPSNVLLTGEDHSHVKVGDVAFWGVMTSQSYGKEAKSDVDDIARTWIAPEPLKKKAFLDDADVFSFGLVLYFILSGNNPPIRSEENDFAFQNPKALKKSLPNDTPAPLWNLVAQCIDPAPKNRPPFSDIVETLRQTIEDLINPPKDKAKGKEKDNDAEVSSSSSEVKVDADSKAKGKEKAKDVKGKGSKPEDKSREADKGSKTAKGKDEKGSKVEKSGSKAEKPGKDEGKGSKAEKPKEDGKSPKGGKDTAKPKDEKGSKVEKSGSKAEKPGKDDGKGKGSKAEKPKEDGKSPKGEKAKDEKGGKEAKGSKTEKAGNEGKGGKGGKGAEKEAKKGKADKDSDDSDDDSDAKNSKEKKSATKKKAKGSDDDDSDSAEEGNGKKEKKAAPERTGSKIFRAIPGIGRKNKESKD